MTSVHACQALSYILLAVAVDYGETAVLAKGPVGDLDAGRGLAAFVFLAVHRRHDLADDRGVKALGNHVLVAKVVFYVRFHHRVKHVVLRQTVGV